MTDKEDDRQAVSLPLVDLADFSELARARRALADAHLDCDPSGSDYWSKRVEVLEGRAAERQKSTPFEG